MKKVVRVMLVMLLIVAMAVPAFGATNFVGSIGEKPAPELVPIEGTIVGTIIDDQTGEPVGKLGNTEIIVTEYKDVKDAEHIDDDEEKVFIDEYNKLKDGTTDLNEIGDLKDRAQQAMGKDADANDLVVRDYVDIDIVGDDAEEWYKKLAEGHSLKLRFDLGIDKDTYVDVMSFYDGSWHLAKSVKNNGRYVEVIFDNICPVAFLVETDGGIPGGVIPETGDNSNVALWGGLCLAAVAGIVILLKSRKKA